MNLIGILLILLIILCIIIMIYIIFNSKVNSNNYSYWKKINGNWHKTYKNKNYEENN